MMPNPAIDRSAEQRRFARCWVPAALRASPVGHWNR